MSVPQKSQNDPVSLEELIGGEGRLIGGEADRRGTFLRGFKQTNRAKNKNENN